MSKTALFIKRKSRKPRYIAGTDLAKVKSYDRLRTFVGFNQYCLGLGLSLLLAPPHYCFLLSPTNIQEKCV